MDFKRYYNFINRYKTFIFLPLISLMLYLASFSYIFEIPSIILAVFLLLISDFNYTVCYSFYFQMFSGIQNFSKVVVFSATLLICIKYIIGIISKTEKFYPVQFFLTVLICVVFTSFSFEKDGSGIYQGSAIIALLFSLYLTFVYKDKINLHNYFDFIIYGLLVTSILSLSTLLFSGCKIDVFLSYEALNRLKLFTTHTNSLALYCELSLAYYIYAILNKKGNKIKNFIFAIIVICFGLLTLSKTFLLLFIVSIIYIIIMVLNKYRLKSFYVIAPLFFILIIISLILGQSIFATFSRFFNQSGKSIVNQLTTGRTEIWAAYIYEITSSIPKMLFGHGLFNARLIDIGPHNFYLHLLYRIGFVGVILIGILLYTYIKNWKNLQKPTLKNSYPFVILFAITMVECLF